MSSIISKLINLAGNITGTLPVVNGGTGVTTSTGTTNVVLSNSPTLVTPVLGTPASGNLSNCTNYPTATRSALGITSSYWPTIASSVLTTTSANYLILDADGYQVFLFSTGATGRTLTLPSAANNAGRLFRVVKTDSGVGQVQIVGTINGSTSSTITNALNYQYGSCTIGCDGTNFFYVEPITENGTWTPGISNVTNTSALSANLSQFVRVGGTVTCYGEASATSGAGTAVFALSLPITPTNFSTAYQGNGVAVSANGVCWVVFSQTTNPILVSISTTGLVTNGVQAFNFSYRL